MTIALKCKYYYQEQERQDELGLNWDSFKCRNYDYATGRFMSIDPLAEKYPYNSTYAFQENKLGLGRELEGLELVYTDSNGAEHAGPFNPDNVPDDWQEVEQDSNELYSEPLPAVEITYKKPSESTGVDSNNDDNSSAGEILASGSVIAAEISQLDSPAPGPADAVAGVWEAGVLIYAGFVSVKNIINSNNQIPTQPVISPAMPGYMPNSGISNKDDFAEHTAGARPSTKGKHQKGQARQSRDRGGEKGDNKRHPKRKRPKGWRGKWPPKE